MLHLATLSRHESTTNISDFSISLLRSTLLTITFYYISLVGIRWNWLNLDNSKQWTPVSTIFSFAHFCKSSYNQDIVLKKTRFFDSILSFSDHISYISKSCFSRIRDLRRIRNTLDHKTACTIATSLIHSKLDYCNSLYLNISNQQLNRLQLILNSAARAVTKTPKFHHITPQ